MIDKYPDFLPQWTKAILATNRYGTEDGDQIVDKIRSEFGLNYMRTTCCLTGEAFFNTDAPVHSCRTCNDMTYDGAFAAISKGETVLFMYKRLLAEHLKKEHPVIWKKWENHP